MTSWTKRISYVAQSIEYFMTTQTVKPDIFYLWLAEEEFPSKTAELPIELLQIIDKFDIQLRWTKTNEYIHKRWNIYPEHYNDLVISIDDDCRYSVNIIKNAIIQTELHPKSVCLLWKQFAGIPTYSNDIKNNRFILADQIHNNERYDVWFCGQCAIPPSLFPLEMFNLENIELRNTISKVNDETWIYLFLLKNSISTVYIPEFTQHTFYDNSQSCGIVNIVHVRDTTGYSMNEKSLYYGLVKMNLVEEYQKIFPKYNISKALEILK